MFLSTGTINHYYIYPNEKHWNFFFPIADLNVTILNELEHNGLEVSTTSTQVFKQLSSTYLNNTTLGLDFLAYIQDRKCTLLNVGGL